MALEPSPSIPIPCPAVSRVPVDEINHHGNLAAENWDTDEQNDSDSSWEDVNRSEFVNIGSLTQRAKKALASSLTSAVSKLMPGVPSSPFESTCKELLAKLREKHIKGLLSEEAVQDLNGVERIMNEKEICVGVFGPHNCGKSTFLNAFLGDEYLPVSVNCQTSIKVKIQHDGSIHFHTCSEHSCKGQSNACPKLHVLGRNGKEEIYSGPDAIYEQIESLNKQVRKEMIEPPEVVLRVNIPVLSDKVPPGWTVYLVDNPGFGENKEQISQLAGASMKVSCAYIYLLSIDYIGGKAAASFFQELGEKDRGALNDHRLVVGISKFDTFYDSQRPEKRGRSKPISREYIQKEAVESINTATGIPVSSDDTVVPLCGQWALAGERLYRNEAKTPEAVTEARKYLEMYPDPSLPGGQEQSLSGECHHSDVVLQLERASGMFDLKERVKHMVGSACVEVWATRILSGFQRCGEVVGRNIVERCEVIKSNTIDKREVHDKSKFHYDGITQSRRFFKVRHSEQGKEGTVLWQDLKKAYENDLAHHKPQSSGKEKVKVLVSIFRKDCEEKIYSKKLGPKRFEKVLADFLKDSATELQVLFDTTLGFEHMQRTLQKHTVHLVEGMTRLSERASHFLKIEDETKTHNSSGSGASRRDIVRTPNLSDIKQSVHIPDVDLSVWEKLLKIVLYLFDIKLAEKEDADVNYKSLTSEFEQAFSQIQSGMEERCDSYFQKIESKAIKYFSKEFAHETQKQLRHFEKVFSGPLKDKEQSLKQLERGITSMEEEISALKQARKTICNLVRKLESQNSSQTTSEEASTAASSSDHNQDYRLRSVFCRQ